LIQSKNYDLPKYFVFILAMLTSISPLAIDAYIPSFSEISHYFYTSIEQVEITLSIYLLGFGIGQLLGGPLSDRYGRKAFIYTGLTVYIIFSLSISQAGNIHEVWLFRFFQAVGGGFAVVNTSAIVRDLFEGREAAKVFSIISMIIMIAPMVAPILGLSIVHFFTWQYIFIFLCVYALCLVYFIRFLPETSPKNKKGKLFANYYLILKNRRSMFLIFANAFGLGGLFLFITKASFIYIEHFHLSKFYFGLFFSLNVGSLMLNSRINMKLLDKFPPERLFFAGLMTQLLISLTLFTISSFITMPLALVVIGFMLFTGTLGYVFGNSMALILESYKKESATATALNGVMGFIVAACVGFVVSSIQSQSLHPIYIVMLITSFISFIFLNCYKYFSK
jgi:MFS transporter, DHA1 family, multidrug resistance protein